MVGFIEVVIIYLFIGLIVVMYEDEGGDSRNMMAKLLGRFIKWPATLYDKYIKDL